jgi:hypothetical protein
VTASAIISRVTTSRDISAITSSRANIANATIFRSRNISRRSR